MTWTMYHLIMRHKLDSKRHVLAHCFHSVGTRVIKLLSPPPWMSWANFRKQRKQQSYRLCFHLTFSFTVHNHKKRLTLLEGSFRNVGLDRDTLPLFKCFSKTMTIYSEIVSNGKCMSFEGFLVVTRLTHFFSYLYKQKNNFEIYYFFFPRMALYHVLCCVVWDTSFDDRIHMCSEHQETPFLLIPYMISYFSSNLYPTIFNKVTNLADDRQPV